MNRFFGFVKDIFHEAKQQNQQEFNRIVNLFKGTPDTLGTSQEQHEVANNSQSTPPKVSRHQEAVSSPEKRNTVSLLDDNGYQFSLNHPKHAQNQINSLTLPNYGSIDSSNTLNSSIITPNSPVALRGPLIGDLASNSTVVNHGSGQLNQSAKKVITRTCSVLVNQLTNETTRYLLQVASQPSSGLFQVQRSLIQMVEASNVSANKLQQTNKASQHLKTMSQIERLQMMVQQIEQTKAQLVEIQTINKKWGYQVFNLIGQLKQQFTKQ